MAFLYLYEIANFIVLYRDKNDTKTVVSSGYATITLLSLAWLIATVIIVYIVNWNSFFNISVQLISPFYLKLSVIITILGIVFQMVLKLISSIFNAFEETAIPNLLTLSTNVIIVMFLAIYRSKNDTLNLVILSVVYFVATTLPYIFASIIAYSGRMKEIRPSVKCIDIKIGKSLLTLSANFFIIQILLMVVTATNEAFITKLTGVRDVVTFQVYFKLYNTILILFSLVTNPVWSSITKKWQLKDYKNVKLLYKKLVMVAVLCCIGTVVFSIVLQPIINLWLGDKAIVVSMLPIIAFVSDTIIMLLAYAFAAVSNAISCLKPQMVCYAIAAALNYPMAYILVKMGFGWPAIVISNALVMFPYIILQPIALSKQLNVKTN